MEPLKKYIQANRPFFGICLGMQSLFEGSDESKDDIGLGIIPGRVTRFNSVNTSATSSSSDNVVRVPQIGWNGCSVVKNCSVTDFLSTTSSSEVSFSNSNTAIRVDYLVVIKIFS
jgi:glutamine amidotransferase/cyclase